MTKYITRPGVTATSICGEYYLVAAKAAQEFCPYANRINSSSAFLWNRLRHGADIAELISAVEEEFEIEDREVAENAIRGFVDQMLEMNYLLRVEQKGEHENEA